VIALNVANLVKRYGATRALTGLNFHAESGSVIGVAGPNGAGKSTLIRILSGEERSDDGEITLTRDSQVIKNFNVAVVHQEPQVWPNLTVRQNLAVGRETTTSGRIGPGPGANSVMATLDIARFADFELADLSLAVHQRVEIARAIMHRADVFLFDEPNSALTDEESKALFMLMRRLAEEDRIVILVTHRLIDLVNACKVVLILRDGSIVAELGRSEPISEAAIAGRLTSNSKHPSPSRLSGAASSTAKPLMRLIRSSDPSGAFRNVSLDIVPGRILVLAGVEGSGARELTRAIGGFRWVEGVEGDLQRVEYVAASRRDTVFPNLSVGENILIRLGRRHLTSPGPWLNRKQMNIRARACLSKYSIKAGDVSDPVVSLSGGNQQKVVLAAALERNALILAVEEPTRGVDIASKQDIYALMRELCERGSAVVLFCTEVPEMFDIADNIAVMSRGMLVGAVTVDEIKTVSDLVELLAQYEAGRKPTPTATITHRAVQ
jgi:ABC-type sugar transport system ATPase subunit